MFLLENKNLFSTNIVNNHESYEEEYTMQIIKSKHKTIKQMNYESSFDEEDMNVFHSTKCNKNIGINRNRFILYDYIEKIHSKGKKSMIIKKKCLMMCFLKHLIKKPMNFLKLFLKR